MDEELRFAAPPHRATLVAVAAALNNVVFGYDVGVISGSLTDMANSLHLSTIEQEAATSGLNYVSGLGAVLVSGNIMDRFGRRPTLLVASLLLLLGSAIVACAPSFAVLLLGRALQGLGSGTGWAACTVYITEVSPAECRGALVAISDIAINFGILLGYALDRAVNLGLASYPDARWRVATGLATLLPLVYCFACHPFLPESPRWLLMAGREAEAVEALRRTLGRDGGAEDEARVSQQLASIKAAPRTVELSWRESLFPSSRQKRHLVWVAVALGLAQQLTGTEAYVKGTSNPPSTPPPSSASLLGPLLAQWPSRALRVARAARVSPSQHPVLHAAHPGPVPAAAHAAHAGMHDGECRVPHQRGRGLRQARR